MGATMTQRLELGDFGLGGGRRKPDLLLDVDYERYTELRVDGEYVRGVFDPFREVIAKVSQTLGLRPGLLGCKRVGLRVSRRMTSDYVEREYRSRVGRLQQRLESSTFGVAGFRGRIFLLWRRP
jgi:hypothetical protein